MSDDTADGAVPVEDAAVPDPPTVDQLLERQRAEHPEQFVRGEQASLPEDAPVDGENGGG